MKWIQAIRHKFTEHKYAINAKLLGDDAECAWTNLGYWDDTTSSYPQACMQLAAQLAQFIQLDSKDRVVDLGCGQGASLQYWFDHYQIQHLEAVELQQQCIVKIQKQLPQLTAIHHQSFLNLKDIPFKYLFDAVLCIDAAYHSDLTSFIQSVFPVLNSKGRLGFHYLMLSDDFINLNPKLKLKYTYLLKAADVNFKNLKTHDQIEYTLTQQGFEQIEIQDISKAVLKGFSRYIASKPKDMKGDLDQFKIQMTAKLCQSLFNDGIVQYVQIKAVKSGA